MGAAAACGGAGPEVAGAWRATRSSPADSAGRAGQPGPAALAAAPSGPSAVRPHATRLRRGGAPTLRPCPEEEAKYLHVYAAPRTKLLGGRAGTVCTRSTSPTSTGTQLPPARAPTRPRKPPEFPTGQEPPQCLAELGARKHQEDANPESVSRWKHARACGPCTVLRAQPRPRSARAGNPGVPARTGSCHRLPDTGVCGAPVSRARA